MKQINWKKVIIEILKAVIAVFAGTQM